MRNNKQVSGGAVVARWPVPRSCDPKVAGSSPSYVKKGIRRKSNCLIFANANFSIVQQQLSSHTCSGLSLVTALLPESDFY